MVVAKPDISEISSEISSFTSCATQKWLDEFE